MTRFPPWLAATDGEADVKGPAPKKWGKSRPYFATVVAQEGLCTLTGPGDKNTVRTELCLGDSGITYLPGDALGMYPTNKAEVRRVRFIQSPQSVQR